MELPIKPVNFVKIVQVMRLYCKI